LNQIVEIVGVLSLAAQLTQFNQQEEDDTLMGGGSLPPTSSVPRLHVLALKVIDRSSLVVPVQQIPQSK
jgi:hypothetical protein